ncbi:PLP-dependent aminotransferase family protein [Brevibacterium sp. RIT 803]|uniref:aminotransferase-like domain-containing protein n=1 Tax=Brevibacterium sp. RIT 803 TaxID=2810210 RepID=UPI001951F62B|nr:PLP-dependent aminotransferase family protein [Brevibacterium sp. RIT 803]MBM6589550.1 PLP-dependent aminotransferase family protein [Brevibacterium sp. RIT 803]
MINSSSDRIVSALGEWLAVAPAGAQLPSTRQLVARFEASPVTVQKALRTLIGQGVIESRPGVGTFVRRVREVRPNDYGWQTAALGSPQHRIPASSVALRTTPNDVIALHSGYPDRELLPERLVRAAFARAARSEAAVSRPPAAGLPELQSWFAAELGAITPTDLTAPAARDVVIVPGSQSGLSTLFRTLVGAGRPLLIESPSYWGAMLAAAQVGVQLVPIPSGPHGPNPDDLDRAFAQTGARAFYAQPNFANPTGGQWSAELGDAVLGIVRERGAFLIEDDWAHDFGITTDSVPIAARDDSGHVVYIRSLTKSVSPSVRVAGLIARGPARDRILADTQAQEMYVSSALQAIAVDVVTQPAWRTHLRSLRQQLATRRDLLVDALHEHAPAACLDAVPYGGLNLWLRLPDDTNLLQLARECEARGVIIAAGDDWFPAEPTGRYLRLNYSGPNPSAFPEAARIIGQALANRQ